MKSIGVCLTAVLLAAPASAQERSWPDGWTDPHPHKTRYVEVDKDVKLEVLDWGGQGRPVILLAGLGNTAHNFDTFAPKLTRDYRVFAVTRRGYGYSSQPESGYDVDRLADDVLAVIRALKLKQKPVLVGHSIAGQELSSIASRQPESIVGVVYIDGASEYAMAIPKDDALYGVPEWKAAVDALEEKLESFKAQPPNSLPLAREILANELPGMQKVLEQLVAARSVPAPSAPTPQASDFASWPAAMAFAAKHMPFAGPESDWRITHSTPEGLPGLAHSTPKRIPQAINAGEKETFTSIPVPALSLYRSEAQVTETDPALRKGLEARYAIAEARLDRLEKIFLATASQGRVVRVPGADHAIHLSHPEIVVRELKTFTASLPK